MDNDTTVTIPVHRDVLARCQKAMPHGMRTAVYRSVLDLILNMLEKPGGHVLVGFLIEGHVELVVKGNADGDQIEDKQSAGPAL